MHNIFTKYQIKSSFEEYLALFPEDRKKEATPILKEIQKLLLKSDRIFWAAKAISQDPQLWKDPETQATLKHIASMFRVHPQLQSFKFEKSWDWKTGVEKFKEHEKELLKLHQSRLVEKAGKKFIDLGGGWAWWDLKTGGCEKEGKALNHCGNVQSKYRGDTLLSLRKEVGNQYEPFLTFVLNKGVLGEMKARGNEKPRKKYHKYITKLLEDPRIVHIWGGGYDPHRNFHFEDLTPEEQTHILKLKPDFVFDPLEEIPSNHKLPAKHKKDVEDHNNVIEMLKKSSGVKTLTPEVLKQVALKDENWEVRRAAVHKIQDQEVLKEVALKDGDWGVREAAVLKIQDQEVLKEVALKDEHWEVRRAAVKKLQDQEVLKNLALKAGHWRVREAAVDKIQDQEVLKEVALKAGHLDVRKAAVHKIQDQEVLKKVALKDEDWQMRKTAVEKLQDQEVLKEVALKDGDWQVRRTAVEKLQDQEVLKKVALKDEYWAVRSAAVKKIKDQEVLKQVVLKDESSYVREAAVTKIQYQEVLKEVVLKDKDTYVREAATKRLRELGGK